MSQMNYTSKIICLCVSMGLLVKNEILAQIDTSGLTLSQVEVIKEFEVTLEQSRSLHLPPTVMYKADYLPTYTYALSYFTTPLQYPKPEIIPLAMTPDEPYDIKNTYVTLGYGTRSNPLVEVGTFKNVKDGYEVGAQFTYEKLDNSTKIPLQKFNLWQTHLFGGYLVRENLKIRGKLDFGQENRQYFSTILARDTQDIVEKPFRWQNFDFALNVYNPERTTLGINYDLGIENNQTQYDINNRRENNFATHIKLERPIKKSTIISISSDIYNTSYNGDTTIGLTTVQLHPSIKSNIGPVIFRLGMQYISDSDTLNTLFPSAELSLGIKKFHLQTFMGTNQSFSSNNLRTLRFANPFINTSLSDINNNLIREAYIGIRGQIASAMYEIKAGYKNLRQRALFVQNAHMPYLSDIIIDNVNLIFLHGEWDITLQDGLTLNGSLTSNVFKPKNQDEAWNLPPLEGEIGLVWIGFDNKFKLHPHLFFASTMPLGLDEGTTIQSSKSNRLYELNIQANYQVHRFVQGFIHAQNLLNNKWERWLGYPTVGVNVVGGITVHW